MNKCHVKIPKMPKRCGVGVVWELIATHEFNQRQVSLEPSQW